MNDAIMAQYLGQARYIIGNPDRHTESQIELAWRVINQAREWFNGRLA